MEEPIKDINRETEWVHETMDLDLSLNHSSDTEIHTASCYCHQTVTGHLDDKVGHNGCHCH